MLVWSRSNFLEVQVAVHMLEAVTPEEHTMLERNLLGPLHHQSDDLVEVGFACFEMSGVDVGTLEVGEPELNRSCRVAVRS